MSYVNYSIFNTAKELNIWAEFEWRYILYLDDKAERGKIKHELNEGAGTTLKSGGGGVQSGKFNVFKFPRHLDEIIEFVPHSIHTPSPLQNIIS
jgi:hypothetical protein